jgi:hypothetical protein
MNQLALHSQEDRQTLYLYIVVEEESYILSHISCY